MKVCGEHRLCEFLKPNSGAHRLNFVSNTNAFFIALTKPTAMKSGGSRVQQPVFSLFNCGNKYPGLKAGEPILAIFYRLCGLFLMKAERGAESDRHCKPTTTI